eukprot:11106394-Alexandrium_andersonii.AAC.1
MVLFSLASAAGRWLDFTATAGLPTPAPSQPRPPRSSPTPAPTTRSSPPVDPAEEPDADSETDPFPGVFVYLYLLFEGFLSPGPTAPGWPRWVLR